MNNIFNSVKVFKPRSNRFDLSHDFKFSANMGNLIPICTIDCVPGDRINISAEALIRLAPMTSPVMHHMDVTMHYYFVPNRLLWDNWEKYITNTKVGSFLPAFPTLGYMSGTAGYTELMDYLGLPDISGFASGVTEVYSALPMAAYQLIYNSYYRDQNLIAEADYKLVDGDNSAIATSLKTLRKRAWEHDYFTAALPFAQKGDAVEIPITGNVSLVDNLTGKNQLLTHDDFSPVELGDIKAGAGPFATSELEDVNSHSAFLDPNQTMEVKNADTNINDLRRAYALQRFLEKLARGGSRLTEVIRTVFGVNSSDKRLQRPEYITGIKTPIVISEVLNTTGTVDAPQGDMAGHGVGVTAGRSGSYFCEEHGYLIGIMSVMPRTAYQQGIPKHFLKVNDPYEFFWPDFANIGEQEVLQKELYAGVPGGDETFGYVPRYSEYKYHNARTAGQFKTTLNNWTMTRIFSSIPLLNQQFVEADPTHRIFAVTDPAEHKLWCHVYNKVHMSRLMPKYGTPTF